MLTILRIQDHKKPTMFVKIVLYIKNLCLVTATVTSDDLNFEEDMHK